MADKRIIGIQTIYRDVLLTNYGSFFQHYALRRVLRAMGYACYRCETDAVRDELSHFILVLRKIRVRVLSWVGLRNRPNELGVWQMWLRYRFIRDFKRLIAPLFENQCEERTWLYLAGGDSVWCCKGDVYYLLDRDKSVPRISYAASAAWDKGEKDATWVRSIRDVVLTYRHIGVREETGVNTIKAICPCAKVDEVVDPVLLLSRNELLDVCRGKSMRFRKKTLLYYVVNIWSEGDLNLSVMKCVADRLSCDLKIVGIQGAEKYIPPEFVLRPSPCEFMAMVRDSDYFITNSFHGIVFSVMLGKRFAFVKQAGTLHGDQNCRQRNLLKKFRLETRMVGAYPTIDDVMDVLQMPLPKTDLESLMERERKRCLAWLKDAVS